MALSTFPTFILLTMSTDPGDEQVPLLHSEPAQKKTPFPWFQFSILFALQTAEYLTLQTIYPFLPELIRTSGIAKEEKDVGYYVGLLISTKYGAEIATTFSFARLSDHVGGKLVFLACAIGSSLSISGFGLSTKLWSLVLCKALIGAFQGTPGVTKSMLAKMIDSTDMARAIAYYEISWYVAGIIGPEIGGSLSRPAEQFPQLFGSIEFLKKYPYFLPCAICSAILLIAWLVGSIFLKETMTEPLPLSSLFKKGAWKVSARITGERNGSFERPLSLRTLLVPTVIIAATNLAATSMLEKFFWGTEALFLSTPVDNGGLGFSPSAIGTFSSFSSILIGASQLFVFPFLNDKWGSRCVVILGVSASIPRFILWPVMNWIARRDGRSGLLWFALGSQACCSVFAQFSCIAVWVLIIQSHGKSPSLGAIAGFCQVCCSDSSTYVKD
ncbi:hypothetical protein AX14_004679 [Amanita brunnescens Koide BX004]|nr:hypothetical protein AX14_004679 [Amanita brunnescens Koide BX004]